MKRPHKDYVGDNKSSSGVLRHNNCKVPNYVRLQGINKLSKITSELDNLFTVCLDRMLPHMWFRIVPNIDDRVHDISNATGILFALLSTVMLYMKYIYIQE